ncbi:MAG: porin [Armatimonadota bacterium]
MKTIHIAALCLLAIVPSTIVTADTETDQKIARLEKQLMAIQKELSELKTTTKTNNPVQAPAKDTIKITGYVQSWLTVDNRSDRADHVKPDTFRLRRALVNLDGTIGKASWQIQIDPVRDLILKDDPANPGKQIVDQSSRMLNEAWVAFPIVDNWKLTLGQQRVPFGFEGLMSSAKIETVERSMMTTKGLSMQYEIGAYLSKAGKDGQVALAVVNGSGMNNNDNNDVKNMAMRLVSTPGKAWSIGASGSMGWSNADRSPDNRLGAELQYKDKDWTLRSEIYEARKGDGLAKTEPCGFYALAAKRINPAWEIVTRWDQYDPNRWAASDNINEYTLGVNHNMKDNMLWQINFVHSNPAVGMKTDMLINNLQILF